YEATKLFAHELAKKLERERQDLVVSSMKKTLRANKVFIDWSQNDDHKTTVCVYSLRAKERPTVSTPVTWKEVEECLRKQDPELLVFDPEQVLARVKRMGDLFKPVQKLKQRMPALKAVTDSLVERAERKATKVPVSLGTYQSKRRFDATPEPPPTIEQRSRHRFVVQKHRASHL